jgi:cell division protein FtsW
MNTWTAAATGSNARVPPDYDLPLLWMVGALAIFGLVMVYSASVAIAEADRYTGHNGMFYLIRHSVFLVIGVTAGIAAFQFPLSAWQKYAPWLFIAGTFLLVLVLIPGLGRNVNGSQRWIPLGIVNLQPSELMKLFAVLYAADYTLRKAAYMHSVRRGFFPMLMVMLVVGWLLLREPDFGAFAVIIAIAVSTLFLGGFNWRLFAGLIVLLVVGFVVLIWSSPYRMARVVGFMDPFKEIYGAGYQLSHALIAFGRGEWLGVGLGASVEKLFYLPEAHTDFLLAVIAEELGLVGVLAVVGMFGWITLRAFHIGRQAAKLDRLFGALTAQGIGMWIGVQAGINMGVNMGLLPTKGLTLPLMSFGGSGIVANLVAVALLVRVDYENRLVMRGKAVP